MGMLGQYMLVDDVFLDRLLQMDCTGLVDEVEALSDEEDAVIYDIDKLWDGLHFLLTGVSAGEPIEDNGLSEAIIGVHVFDCENFVACTEYAELPKIIEAMQQVDINVLKANFDLAKFVEHDIYPDIWREENRESLFVELINEFHGLLSFYKQAFKLKKHVLVSIY